jgi:integrase
MGVKVREVEGKGWYVFINWRNQRKAKCFGTDKTTAKTFAKKLSARLKWADVSGEPIALSQPDQQVPTVKAYLEEWLLTHAKMHCKPSTYRRYKEVIDQQLIPAFGDRPLHLLKREDLKRLITRAVEANKARGTIQNYLIPLKAAYNHAKEDGLVTFNPAERFTRLLQRGQDRRKHIQPLTREELAIVLAYAETHEVAYFPAFLCAARTGLRQGEVIGLEWGDLDSVENEPARRTIRSAAWT